MVFFVRSLVGEPFGQRRVLCESLSSSDEEHTARRRPVTAITRVMTSFGPVSMATDNLYGDDVGPRLLSGGIKRRGYGEKGKEMLLFYQQEVLWPHVTSQGNEQTHIQSGSFITFFPLFQHLAFATFSYVFDTFPDAFFGNSCHLLISFFFLAFSKFLLLVFDVSK